MMRIKRIILVFLVFALSLSMLFGCSLFNVKDTTEKDASSEEKTEESKTFEERKKEIEEKRKPGGETTETTEEAGSSERKHFGFIKKVYVEHGYYDMYFLEIDYAQFLTGEKANEAAVEEGEIQPGESVPNDYYIKNASPNIRTFEIDEDAEITIQTLNMEEEGIKERSIDIETFFDLFKEGSEEDSVTRYNPYWVYFDGDIIIKIEEQYLP